LIQGSSEEDAEAGKGKGKGPRKWDGSEDEFKPEDKSEEEKVSEEDEEDVASDDMNDSSEDVKNKSTYAAKKKVSAEVSDEDSEEEDIKKSNTPDISDESEVDEPAPVKPQLKPVPASPMVAAAAPVHAPPLGEESDSDDFQSPATPSEDEDED